MIPLLAQLGLALVSAKMQKDEENKARENARRKQLDATLAGIRDKRAARAGDSGYMQAAISGMQGSPGRPQSSVGPMLSQLGTALMSQDAEPVTTARHGAAAGTFNASSDASKGWAGSDWNDEENKYGNIA